MHPMADDDGVERCGCCGNAQSCVCGKRSGEVQLFACSRCRAQRYCSEACQRADYPAHKPRCLAHLAAEAAEAGRKARAGDAASMCQLGLMMREGRGMPKDAAGGVAMVKRAAEAGNAEACAQLSLMYNTGDGVPESRADGNKWALKAAEAGHVVSMYNLSVVYGTGLGVPIDEPKAVAFLRRAADAGVGMAAFNLANRYRYGRGIERSAEAALLWYQTAARLGVQLDTKMAAQANSAAGSLLVGHLGMPAIVPTEIAMGWPGLRALDPVAGAAHIRKAAEQVGVCV